MEYLTAGPAASLHALLLLGLAAWAALRGGSALLAWTGLAEGVDPDERNLFSIGLGFIALSLGVLALGSAGLLSRPWMAGWIAVLGVLPWKRPGLPRADVSRPFLFFAGLVFVLSFLQACAPPIGTDSLHYHLQHPRLFLKQGSIGYLQPTRESLWPYQMEMLFTLGLLFQGTTLAVLFHWIFYPLGVFATYLLGKRLLGRGAGELAALAFAFTPAVFSLSGDAYVDVGFTFYAAAAALALVLYAQEGKGRLVLLCGLLSGGMLGIKYFGITACAALVAAILFVPGPRFLALLLFGGGALLTGGVWYLRQWLILGNPLYPFFPDFFGNGLVLNIEAPGLGTGWRYYPALLWNMTLKPSAFGGELFNPLYLAFLPLLAFVGLPKRTETRAAAVFAFAYSLLLFKQAQYTRFTLPLLPVLSVGVAAAAQEAASRGRILRAATMAAFAAAFVLHLGIDAHRLKKVLPVVAGTESADAYLFRCERAYPATRWLRENLKPGERAFNSADPRVFYLPESVLTDTAFFRQKLEREGFASRVEYLKKENYDYLWLLERTDPDLFLYAKEAGYAPVYEYAAFERPARFRYFIFKKS